MSRCYNATIILTLSVSSCVKGANMVKTAGMVYPYGQLLLPRPQEDRQFLFFGGMKMDTRVAVMSVIVENGDAVEKLNAILHEYGEFIIGRMGIPYRKRKVSIVSIALDAPQNTISALAGKIGTLPGVSVKTAYSSVIGTD